MKISVPWRRRIVLALIGVLVAWGLFQGFRPQPVEGDLGTASRAPLRVTIKQEERTRVLDRYLVTAPVNGYARRVRLDVGRAVERGATLVELEPLRAEVLDPRPAPRPRPVSPQPRAALAPPSSAPTRLPAMPTWRKKNSSACAHCAWQGM